jgi:hypothetical protein
MNWALLKTDRLLECIRELKRMNNEQSTPNRSSAQLLEFAMRMLQTATFATLTTGVTDAVSCTVRIGNVLLEYKVANTMSSALETACTFLSDANGMNWPVLKTDRLLECIRELERMNTEQSTSNRNSAQLLELAMRLLQRATFTTLNNGMSVQQLLLAATEKNQLKRKQEEERQDGGGERSRKGMFRIVVLCLFLYISHVLLNLLYSFPSLK